jgi:hypothetical protein
MATSSSEAQQLNARMVELQGELEREVKNGSTDQALSDYFNKIRAQISHAHEELVESSREQQKKLKELIDVKQRELESMRKKYSDKLNQEDLLAECKKCYEEFQSAMAKISRRTEGWRARPDWPASTWLKIITALGACIGGAIGIVFAIFTFGLSIPLGAVMGGACAFCSALCAIILANPKYYYGLARYHCLIVKDEAKSAMAGVTAKAD